LDNEREPTGAAVSDAAESVSSVAATEIRNIYGTQAIDNFMAKYNKITSEDPNNDERDVENEKDTAGTDGTLLDCQAEVEIESDEDLDGGSLTRKRKRKAFRENSVSKFVPYFVDAGRNSKGNPLMRCLLRPNRIGHHPDVFCCSHTGHMSSHMNNWHLPALTKLKELNEEGRLSRQEIINRILTSYGVQSTGEYSI
tara:strand:+ start:404 stop:994 length:591 start_codon:yes stop_codon:yes gene_type:complete